MFLSGTKSGVLDEPKEIIEFDATEFKAGLCDEWLEGGILDTNDWQLTYLPVHRFKK